MPWPAWSAGHTALGIRLSRRAVRGTELLHLEGCTGGEARCTFLQGVQVSLEVTRICGVKGLVTLALRVWGAGDKTHSHTSDRLVQNFPFRATGNALK